MLRSFAVCAGALVLAACATSPSSTVTTAQGTAPLCVPTASRLPTRDGCNAPGQTYSQDQLRQTGQTSPADALRMLDPAVR
jgi:hypothetical protein